MKNLKIILISLAVLFVIIAVAGIIKFNFINDDVIINETNQNQEVTQQETTETPNKQELAQQLVAYPITSNPWKWVGTFDQGNSKNNIIPADPNKFVAQFGNDQQFSTSTDCNSAMASYTTNGTEISFGAMASTMMFCENSNEGAYLDMLSKVKEYNIEGEQLVMLVQDGRIMLFQK